MDHPPSFWLVGDLSFAFLSAKNSTPEEKKIIVAFSLREHSLTSIGFKNKAPLMSWFHLLKFAYFYSARKLFSPKSPRRGPNAMLSLPQLYSTWTAEYMHGRGREAFCLGALRRILNPYLPKAVTSWRSRTCRKTGTTLVMNEEFKFFIAWLSNSAWYMPDFFFFLANYL